MKVFRIEEISLKPVIVLARDMDDAVNIFAYELVMGLGHRPDAMNNKSKHTCNRMAIINGGGACA